MAIDTWPDNDITTPVNYPVTFNDAITINSTLDVTGLSTLADVDCTTLDTTGAMTVGTTFQAGGIATFLSSILMQSDTGGTGGATAPALAFYTDGSWSPTMTQTSGTWMSTYNFAYTVYGRIANAVIYGFQCRINCGTTATAGDSLFEITLPISSNFTGTTNGLGVVSFESNTSGLTTGEYWGAAIRTSSSDVLEMRMENEAITAGQYVIIHAIGIYNVLD